jgi:hypothetical protein
MHMCVCVSREERERESEREGNTQSGRARQKQRQSTKESFPNNHSFTTQLSLSHSFTTAKRKTVVKRRLHPFAVVILTVILTMLPLTKGNVSKAAFVLPFPSPFLFSLCSRSLLVSLYLSISLPLRMCGIPRRTKKERMEREERQLMIDRLSSYSTRLTKRASVSTCAPWSRHRGCVACPRRG